MFEPARMLSFCGSDLAHVELGSDVKATKEVDDHEQGQSIRWAGESSTDLMLKPLRGIMSAQGACERRSDHQGRDR